MPSYLKQLNGFEIEYDDVLEYINSRSKPRRRPFDSVHPDLYNDLIWGKEEPRTFRAWKVYKMEHSCSNEKTIQLNDDLKTIIDFYKFVCKIAVACMIPLLLLDIALLTLSGNYVRDLTLFLVYVFPLAPHLTMQLLFYNSMRGRNYLDYECLNQRLWALHVKIFPKLIEYIMRDLLVLYICIVILHYALV